MQRRWLVLLLVLVACQVPQVGPPPTAPLAHMGPADLSDLAGGIRAKVDEARIWVSRDERTQAVRAIEEASRVASVGRARSDRFVAVDVYLQELREAFHNGQDERIASLLSQPLTVLDGVEGDIGGERDPDGDYEDATLLDVRGQVLGELIVLDRHEIVVGVGQGMDVLGFLDFGGKKMRVPPDKLIFGEDRGFGYTWVVLAQPTSVKAMKEGIHHH